MATHRKGSDTRLGDVILFVMSLTVAAFILGVEMIVVYYFIDVNQMLNYLGM